MSEQWREIEAIFDEVCLLGDETRRAILDQRCHGDETLRSEIERLVRAYHQERAANAEIASSSTGRRFGAWETVRLIARGGMGEVWLARRADGQHEQQAALKILSPYLAASDSVDRFRRERELLARLEHPNIARLMDGGMTPLGEPYLVMEYVEGARLDRYCEERALTVRERLLLFLKVCAAVASAHQYLVVHRDLKPANILVTSAGEPKLLDFGVAKVLNAEGLSQTATANLFLTPLYASPEVFRGQPATIGSDIYSLGVVLYELLTGRRPFDASRLSPAALVESVTEKDPGLPSSACQGKLKDLLRGDLDSIVLKALARNLKERYQSVGELADDLNRYLEGQPVSAVHGSRWYIARKFVRRNALAVSAAAILLLSLSAGLAGTLWQASNARQQRLNAEQRFNDARQLANYLLFDLYDSVGNIPGAMPVQRDMLQRSLQYLDRMSAIRTNDPALRLELAQGYLRLGTILGRKLGSGDYLGDTNLGLVSDRKALAIIEPLAAERPADLATRRTLAAIERQLGVALVVELKYADAFPWLQKSAQISDEIAKSHPTDLASLLDAGESWQTLGKQMSEKGGYVAFNAVVPIEYLNKGVQYFQAALRLSPTNTTALMAVAETYEAIGRADSLPNPSKGTQDYQIGLDALARLSESERQTAEARQVRARLLVLLGWNQGQLGRLKESLATLEAARPLLDAQAAADPQNAGAEYRRFELYRSLGIVYGYARDTVRSLADLRMSLSIIEKIMKRDTGNANYPVLRAEMQGRVATALLRAGHSAEAYPYAQSSVAYFKELGENPAVTPGELMEAIRSTAENAVPSLRDYPAALRFALHADQIANGKNPAILGYLAESYALNNNYRQAADAAKRGLALVPAPKSGQPASQLRQWLQSESADYEAKAGLLPQRVSK